MNKYGNIIQSGLIALSKKCVLKYQRIYKLTRPRSEWPSMVGQRANSVQKPVLFAGLALFFILIYKTFFISPRLHYSYDSFVFVFYVCVFYSLFILPMPLFINQHADL